jgi:hypothetical protein
MGYVKSQFMLALKKEDCEFLLTFSKFCNRIEWYIDPLGLNSDVLYIFKDQSMMLSDIMESCDYWDADLEKLFAVTIENLKTVFQQLSLLCKCSPNYTIDIGVYLGIEVIETFYQFSAN